MTSTILGSTTSFPGRRRRRRQPHRRLQPTPSPALSPGRLPFLSPGACAAVADTLAAASHRWLRLVETDTPDGRWFERIRLDERYDAWLLGWAPGHELDFHDHGGSAGAFHVVRGALLERHTARHSADDPCDRVLLARSTTSFGSDHVHSVSAAGRAPALSIHVYSPPLLAMTHYEVAPGSVPIATSREVC